MTAVDPQSPGTIYASTSHAGGFPARVAARNHPLANGPIGIFKSTDFGETWAQLTNGIPTDLSATDVVLNPSNPSTVYAAIGDIFGDSRNGVYRSTNGGASFTKLGGGLPTSNVGRIALAVSPSQPNIVVASVVNRADSSGGGASTRRHCHRPPAGPGGVPDGEFSNLCGNGGLEGGPGSGGGSSLLELRRSFA